MDISAQKEFLKNNIVKLRQEVSDPSRYVSSLDQMDPETREPKDGKLVFRGSMTLVAMRECMDEILVCGGNPDSGNFLNGCGTSREELLELAIKSHEIDACYKTNEWRNAMKTLLYSGRESSNDATLFEQDFIRMQLAFNRNLQDLKDRKNDPSFSVLNIHRDTTEKSALKVRA